LVIVCGAGYERPAGVEEQWRRVRCVEFTGKHANHSARRRAAALWAANSPASVLQAASLRGFLRTGFNALRANTIAEKLSLQRRLVHIPLQTDKLHVHVWINHVVPPLRLQERDDDALQRDRFDKTRS